MAKEELLEKWRAELASMNSDVLSMDWFQATNRMTARKVAEMARLRKCIMDLELALGVQPAAVSVLVSH